ncbi:PKD domain-containing protein [Haliangium sp.]|uniref:S8 family peptidase n=1 Tax=Haliangium sp. TaxID=2663208 RepID=UPI003D0CD3DE
MNSRSNIAQGWLARGLSVAALAGLVSCTGGVDDASVKQPDLDPAAPSQPDVTTKAAPYADGQILVRFKRDADLAAQASIHSQLGTRSIHTYKYVRNLQVVELPEGLSVDRALAAFKKDPSVLYAEPNLIYQLDRTVPDDTLFGDTWGMDNDGTGPFGGIDDADIDAPEAWDISVGSPNVVVAVLDSGLDYTHPDLADNTFVNDAELNGLPDVDDDGNGIVDDIHGINSILTGPNGAPLGDPFPNDGDEHGTHVSGTIAARGNNAQGVAGVNWEAKLLMCKAFSFSATLVDIIECLDYFLEMKVGQGHNIVASNNSWGGGGFSQALLDAIEAQNAAGMLFVAAAGNSASDNDASPHFPSSYEATNIIAVAASNSSDELASFSSFGATSVDVAAPGEAVVSTIPGGDFAAFSGTSMATPHTTGLVALIKAADPNRTAGQIKNLVLTGGDPAPAADGTTLTGLRINAFGSLTCVDRVFRNRFAPAQDNLVVGLGTPVELGVLSINCDQPNPAEIVVNVVETGGSIPLVGDGTGSFTGTFVPPGLGSFTLEFTEGGQVVDTVFVSAIGNYDPGRLIDTEQCRSIVGTDLLLSDDDSEVVISDFPIQFAGAVPGFTELNVGSNGLMSFSGRVTSFSNQALPSTVADTVMAPYWDDLNPSARGGVFFETIGEAPNRELVIEWRQVPHFFNDGEVTFQAVFTEGSPNILFNYCDITFEDNPGLSGGASATIGVQVSPDVAQQFSFNEVVVQDRDSIIFTIGAPIPVAGEDQIVLPGTAVTLDGSASEDLDGTIVRFTWSQIAGEPVDLIGADTPVATFTAPQTSGTLTFQLEVEDNDGQVSADRVDIIVNLPPIADGGGNQQVGTNVATTLDCSGSTDPDGIIAGFQWRQLAGAPVVLENADTAVASYTTPPVPGFLVFQCDVVDDLGFTDFDVIVVDVFLNEVPVANAGNDQIVRPGGSVTLDGTRSSDAEGPIASFAWEPALCMTIEGPCDITLDDPTSATPSFTAPGATGFAHIALTVTDEAGAVASDSVVVSFAVQAPVAAAFANPECVSPGDTVTLDASTSFDPDGSIVSFAWAQVGGDPVALTGADSAIASFTAPNSGATLSFEVTVTDDDGQTSVALVRVAPSALPVAVPVCDIAVVEGSPVNCDGSGSQNAVEFTWDSPTDPGIAIPPGATTSFIAPDVTVFRVVQVRLTVSNECGATANASANVVVVDAP